MTHRLIFLTFLTAARLPGAEPGDPFAPPVLVTVQCDWIQLPHSTANALIRQQGTGPALQQAAAALLKAGTATRLDVQSLLANAGERTKTESVTDKYYATAFDPPQYPQTLTVEGDWPYELSSPACAQSFTSRNPGRSIEMETQLPGRGPGIQLRIAAEWNGHLVDLPFGSGVSLYPQPVFHHAAATVELRVESGDWHLAGLFTPPPDAKPGAESAPRPDHRVLLFVRATAPGAIPNKREPDSEPAMQPVLAEWIEAEADLIAGLVEATPDFTSAAGMRAALEEPLESGKAVLVETACAAGANKSRAKSVSEREVPWVSEIDPGGTAQTLTLSSRTAAGQPLTCPPFFNAYGMKPAGTQLETTCAPEDGGGVTLEFAATLSALTATDVFGHAGAGVPQPRWQILRSSTRLTLQSGVPALAAILDVPVPAGQALPAVRTRKMLLFVTVLPSP